MAKRRLLQWMRERITGHADKVVIPASERKSLDAAYKKALPLVAAIVSKKFPPSDMKVLAKYKGTTIAKCAKLQYPNGSVVEFKFEQDDQPLRPDAYEYNGQMYLADAATAAAVDRWLTTREQYDAERKKRIAAYTALIAGAGYIEDIEEVWPEVKGILPAGSPPIPLGPEQIALVKADQRERKAA